MKNILGAAAIAASAVAAPCAHAGPLYTLYQFEILSLSCSNGQPSCGGATGAGIGSLQVGIVGNTAMIQVDGQEQNLPDPNYVNSNLYVANFSVLGTPVDLNSGTCNSPVQCDVTAAFAIDALRVVTGNLFSLNDGDMYVMSSDAAGLWSGYFMSDDGMYTVDRRPVFSGVFAAVPEPGSLALLGIGFAGLMFSTRRRT